ncbi:MAG: hypothetical protein K2H91_14245 [Lachnospiraceae bacterium]|nr:hypothetical protein [Lachnospiraceae bacterium]
MAVSDIKPLMIKVMLITYCMFGEVYSFVYAMTSKTYFKIVNKSTID